MAGKNKNNMVLRQHKVLATLVLLPFFVGVPTALAAQIYFFPSEISLSLGETAILEIRMDTEGESISAVEVIGSINSNITTIGAIEPVNTLVKVFVDISLTGERSFRILGGTPNGFQGTGIIGRLLIRADKTGQAEAAFDNISKAILNTEGGTEATLKFNRAYITVGEAVCTLTVRGSLSRIVPSGLDCSSDFAPSHRLPRNRIGELKLHWDLEEGTLYSYLVSLDPVAVPDGTPDRPEGDLVWMGDITVSGLENGIYYFAVKKVGDNPVSHYRAMIDTIAPAWVDFKTSSEAGITGGEEFASFLAEDSLSGISRYEAKVDDQDPEEVISPYVLPSRYKKMTITAYDRAGNSMEKMITAEYGQPTLLDLLLGVVIILGVVVVLLLKGRMGFPRKN